MAVAGKVDFLPGEAEEHRRRTGRPLVTLAYAQSLDGSIAIARGFPLTLSSPEALVLTHRLRAEHDAIMVGIGTVLADDPLLNVRFVSGPDPRPVVLDSQLRLPAGCNLLRSGHSPWVATTARGDVERQAELEKAGSRVIRMPAEETGRVSLPALLEYLASQGISKLMVEGGARVITSFLAGGLVDRLVLTIAPVYIGGLNALERRVAATGNGHLTPTLSECRYEPLGRDIVLWARVVAGKRNPVTD